MKVAAEGRGGRVKNQNKYVKGKILMGFSTPAVD